MNFIHTSMSDKDRLLFFGDPDDTPFTVFADGLTMADLALEVGPFPSLGQARKNGWNKPIPPLASLPIRSARSGSGSSTRLETTMKLLSAVLAASVLLGGCYDFRTAKYDIAQTQNKRDLKAIFRIYEVQCDAGTPPNLKESDAFCDGIREAYWATQSAGWRIGLE